MPLRLCLPSRVFERTRGSRDTRALPASTPPERFFYCWFSAQELASLSGNLPVSHPQPLFSLIVVSQSKTAFATCCRGRLCLPPSLPSWDFSLGGGGALGKRERSLQLPGSFLRLPCCFSAPFPLLLPTPIETQLHTF